MAYSGTSGIQGVTGEVIGEESKAIGDPRAEKESLWQKKGLERQ